MALSEGELLRNRYRVESVLGQGGMGAVYRAFDINLGVGVAVKENLFTSEEYARQFQREATILAGLRHPNLPRVTDHFVIEGQGQYLVMDFIRGDDLREKLENQGAVAEQEAVPWFMEICDALAYLHTRTPSILHRDVKPGNIKITPDGRAILVDFGLAKVMDKSGTTTTGAKAMTPGFSPPEQYGTGSTDPRTDVYSLGATMYASLTATIPEDSLERAMGREVLTPLRQRNPQTSAALSHTIEKALEVRPEARYQSMAEFASALSAASRAGRPTLIRNYPYLEPTMVGSGKTVVGRPIGRVPSGRSRKWPLYALPIIALILIGAGTLYAVPGLQPRLSGLFAPVPLTQTVEAPATQTPAAVASATIASFLGVPTETATSTPQSNSAESTALLSETGTQAPTPIGGGLGQFVFASDREGLPQLWIANVDGSGDRQLTFLPDGACQPSWSPTANEIVFISPCLDSQESYSGAGVWVVDLENRQPRPLVLGPGSNYDPAWAPGGARIAFTSEQAGRPQIHLVNTDGTANQNISDIFAREVQPAWSPENNQLMFVSNRTGGPQIWLMPDAGGDVQRFSFNEREDTHPDWSSDGQLVVFERQIGGIPRLMGARFEDRGNIVFQICQQGPMSAQPMAEARFSPDGNWIIFETWPDGVNHNIAIMTTSCTNYTELTTGPGLNFDPAWRP
jgi:serine/threonine protein kinase/Tol biopolymer transport system component